jgi:hypothetical protein
MNISGCTTSNQHRRGGNCGEFTHLSIAEAVIDTGASRLTARRHTVVSAANE